MELKNYRKFRHCTIEFPDGVIGIVGPNGAGKSSLIEAVAWALYGNEAEIVRTTKEQVRWIGAGPGEECRVALEFDFGGDSYRLERAMRGKDLKTDAALTINGRAEARGDKAVNEEMARRLGMDHKSFFISVFARQKDLNALSNLTASERKRLVLRMLDVDLLDRVITEIGKEFSISKRSQEMTSAALLAPDGRRKSAALREEIEQLGGDLERCRERIGPLREEAESIESEVAEARGRRDEAARKVERHRELSEAASEKRERIRSLVARAAEISEEVADLRKRAEEERALEVAHMEFEAALRRKGEMEAHLRAHEERKGVVRNLEDVRGKLAAADLELAEKKARLAALEGVEERLRTVEESMKQNDYGMSAVRERSSWLRSERARLEKEIERGRSKREEIERLGEDSACPTCERPLGDQHGLLLEKLCREIAEVEEGIRKIDEEAAACESEAKRLRLREEALSKREKELLRQQREALQVEAELALVQSSCRRLEDERGQLESRLLALAEIPFDEEEYSALVARIGGLEPQEDRYTELRILGQRLPLLERDFATAYAQREAAEAELAGIESSLGAIGYDSEEADRALGDYERVLARREECSRRLASMEAEIRFGEKELEIRREQLEEALSNERRLEEASARLDQLSVLSAVMKDFRSNVMSRIVPTLSAISSSLLADLTESKYSGMELDENYEIHVYDTGTKYPLSRFSGGEGDLANLCLRLAISRVIAERAGSDVNLLILDEIFGSQDQGRKRNILSTLNQLSKQFHQIVLITHIEDIKDFMGQVIEVREREDGTSEAALSA